MGDITRQFVDAIVNAANQALVGGGGVDGAIHRSGGPEIMAACARIRDVRGGCPTGSAVITVAGRLDARAVIHTAGPRWHGGDHGEPELLASCYRSSLRMARENGMRTVAFPSISTGVYGYPIEDAAGIAVATVLEILDMEPESFDEVRFVLFSQGDLSVYRSAFDQASAD